MCDWLQAMAVIKMRMSHFFFEEYSSGSVFHCLQTTVVRFPFLANDNIHQACIIQVVHDNIHQDANIALLADDNRHQDTVTLLTEKTRCYLDADTS